MDTGHKELKKMKFTCVDCTQNLKNQTTLECFHHLCNECLRKEIQQQHNANSEKNDKVLLCCSCGYPTPLEKLSTCNQTHSSYLNLHRSSELYLILNMERIFQPAFPVKIEVKQQSHPFGVMIVLNITVKNV